MLTAFAGTLELLRTMDLFDELGPAVAAELSEQRALLPRQLILSANAPERAAQSMAELTPGRRVAVLFDVRTRAAAGDRCTNALKQAGLEAVPVLVQDRDGKSPVCDDVTQRRLLDSLRGLDAVLGVGSGVISDLAKWAAFDLGIPAAIFATAASMNGYAAANVAPAIKGVKSLFSARAHHFVAADPEVLAHAPLRLTTAGLGDVIAKVVSTADWKMNELLFAERVSSAVAGIIDDVERYYTDNPRGIAESDPEAVCALFRALVYSGCAMTLQGSSLPASGGEHLISHALDMRADAEHGEHDLHGRQVGVATIFAAALYQRILESESPDFQADPLPFDRSGWGRIADSVEVHYTKQSVRLAAACGRLREGNLWDRLRQTLSPIVPKPDWVKSVLAQAGGAHGFEHIGCSRERFLWAVYNAAQIRERFTSLDLGWATGILPGAAEDLVDQYLA